MRRRQYLAALGTATVTLGSGCSSPQHGEGGRLQNGSFEQGLDHWAQGTELPEDPNTGTPVVHNIAHSPAHASDGAWSVELFIDGRQDDGTLWVQQPADLRDVETLAFDVYSPEESFNTITKVAAYTGPEPSDSLTEDDFDTERPVEDHAGWKTHEYEVRHESTGLVAVGISVVWETEVTRYVDNVRLN